MKKLKKTPMQRLPKLPVAERSHSGRERSARNS